MIRKLQGESHAKIQVDHSGAGMDANHRQVTITGTHGSVVKAEEMIMFLCANPAVDSMQALLMLIRDKTQEGGMWGSGPPYPNFPNQGQGMPVDSPMGIGFWSGVGHTIAGYSPNSQHNCENQFSLAGVGGDITGGIIESDMFPCAKMYMGRVIGQKGVTVSDLQRRSGCDIQINQNVPAGLDCQISIKGSRRGIQMAKLMLQEIIELGPNHPYAGGRGQFSRIQERGHQGHQQPYQQTGYVNQGYQASPQYSHQQYGLPQAQYGAQQQHPPHPIQDQHYGIPNTPAQPFPWRAATAADGQVYYYNQITQETQWERPAGML